jgi:hypothetical protein
VPLPHTCGAELLAGQLEPPGQARACARLAGQYAPGGHGVGSVELAGQKLPAGHGCTVGLQKNVAWHSVTRLVAPAGQKGHDSDALPLPAGQKNVAGHWVGTLLFSGQYVPAPHATIVLPPRISPAHVTPIWLHGKLV